MRKHTKTDTKGNRCTQARGGQGSKAFLGIDMGDRWSEICEVDSNGDVVQRARLKTTPVAFREYFSTFAGARAALETGTHSGWASRVLQTCALDVTVANAREVRKIHQSDHKNDRADAEMLARLVRVDPALLSPVEHRSAAMQADLALIRARRSYVHERNASTRHAES